MLAERWHLSPLTLRKWRSLRTGPEFVRVGRRPLYPESEVLRSA